MCKDRSRSRSNTSILVIPLVGGGGISIEVAEVEGSSMEVVPAGDFSTTELAAENDDFAMKAESEEVEAESESESEKVESEVKLGRLAEDALRSFLVDPASSPSRSTSAFRLATDRVSIVISSKASREAKRWIVVVKEVMEESEVWRGWQFSYRSV